MSGSEDEDAVESQLKIAIIGDETTGKTALCSRLTKDTFDKQYKQTVGLDFFLKRFTLPGNRNVSLQIWDIGGQQLNNKMIQTYIYGANAIIFVYDVSNHSTFDNLSIWLDVVNKIFAKEEKKPLLSVVGNKKDLEHLRSVDKEKHNEFASLNGMSKFVLSAKSGDKVNYCFQKIAADILGVRLSKQLVENTSRVIKADIVTYNETESAARSSMPNAKSSMCLIQ